MPILLTTPHDPGNGQELTFPRAKLVGIKWFNDSENPLVVLTVEYGDVVEGTWVAGTGCGILEHTVSGQDAADLLEEEPQAEESIYDAAKRVSYALLQSAYSSLAGSVE